MSRSWQKTSLLNKLADLPLHEFTWNLCTHPPSPAMSLPQPLLIFAPSLQPSLSPLSLQIHHDGGIPYKSSAITHFGEWPQRAHRSGLHMGPHLFGLNHSQVYPHIMRAKFGHDWSDRLAKKEGYRLDRHTHAHTQRDAAALYNSIDLCTVCNICLYTHCHSHQ